MAPAKWSGPRFFISHSLVYLIFLALLLLTPAETERRYEDYARGGIILDHHLKAYYYSLLEDI